MRSIRLLWIAVSVMFFGALGLQAQSSLAGTVLDQAGKAVPSATVSVKNESTGAVRTLTTDTDGHFAAADLSAGAYTIEASATGFATVRRTGQQVSEGRAEDISIALSVENVSQAVTVEAVASVAAQLSPSGNTLDAMSAKTEISGQFIRNFTSPVSDFAEVLN